ncbi:MAG: SpoIIE family protein phosphatase [Bacteroidota bacterium]
MKKIITLLLFFLFISSLNAQKPELEFKEILDENGLSFNDINEIKQDSFGFIWFMKWAKGMYRYDGNDVTSYIYDLNDSLTVNNFEASYFFGNNGSFLISLDTIVVDFNTLKNNSISPYQKLIDDTITFRKITEDKYGNLWIHKYYDLYCYNTKTQELKKHYKRYSEELYNFINSKNNNKQIAKLTEITNYQDTSINFTIDNDKKVIIACSGEGIIGMFDYGMILQGADTIWVMDYFKSRKAGGSVINRIEIEVLNLEKGEYTLKYKSDDFHSFNNWIEEKPTEVNFYGCKIIELPPDFGNIEKHIIDSDFDEVLAILLNHDNELCIITAKGLFTKKPNKNFDFCEIDWIKLAGSPIEDLYISDVVSDLENNIWINIGGNISGIVKVDNKNKTSKPFYMQRDVKALVFDSIRNGIWYVLDDLYFFDLETQKEYNYDLDKILNINLKEHELFWFGDIFIDKSANVFVSTSHGIFKTKTKKINSYLPENYYKTVSWKAAHKADSKLYIIDRGLKNIKGGFLSVYDFEKKQTETYQFKNKKIILGKAGVYVSQNKNIWVYQINDLYFYDKEMQLITDSLKADSRILSIFQDTKNRMWLFTLNNICLFDEQEFKLNSLVELNSDEYTDNNIIDFIIEVNSKLFIRTYQGVYSFNTETNDIIQILKYDEIYNYENRYQGNIFYDKHDNSLWFATKTKLYSYNLNTEKVEKIGYVNFFKTIFEEHYINYTVVIKSKNIIWVSTGNGFYKIDTKSKTVKNYSRKDGLFDYSISDMLLDKNENLWFSTNSSIIKFSPENEQFISFYRGNDYPSIYFFHNISDSIFQFKNEIGFFGESGIAAFNPDNINYTLPPVIITKLKLFDREYFPDTIIHQKKQINLNYDQNFISFEFAALDYSDPKRNRYAYMLVGVDKEWIYTDYKDRKSKYTNLAPGKYTFRVKASNNDGIWNEEGVSLTIIITPPFWKTWWFYTLEVIACLLLIFAFIKYRERKIQKEKERLEKTVEERTQEVRQQNEEIKTQNEEIKTQSELVNEQNIKISDSIEYAKKIQSAVLPHQAYIDELLPENFILFKPRDVVSGDFYWIRHINQYIVIAVADCTGHGVPGAIMSMLGISFMNEIVQKREITQANQALNELRKQIKQALRQTGKKGEADDGMDMALCALDTKTNMLQYSGANNSLYLIQNGELAEIKADRMPIGFYPNEKPTFTNHEIQLKDGDIFYLFSDGFMDQFGGKKGFKYKAPNFQKVLLENHNKPMAIQKELLEQELKNWMKGHEQTDDILVMGVRI